MRKLEIRNTSSLNIIDWTRSKVVAQMINQSQQTKCLVAHFFCSYLHKSRVQSVNLFKSYIKQIVNHLDEIKKSYSSDIHLCLRRFRSTRSSPPTYNEIIDKIFLPLNQLLDHPVYIVDGLDECDSGNIQNILEVFRRLIKQSNTRVFIVGRESLDIKRSIPDSSTIYISQEYIKDDIREFVERKIEDKMRERQLTEQENLVRDIKETLIELADRMLVLDLVCDLILWIWKLTFERFLWVSLQIDCLWEECFTDAEIRKALNDLPKDLDETYNRCLRRISFHHQHGHFAPKILRWISAATKPFTINQLREALAIDLYSGRLNRDHMPTTQNVLQCCANLIILQNENLVVFAHHSVCQFLLNLSVDTQTQLFPNGFDLAAAKIELGRLCIAHLSSPDYSLALQLRDASKAQKIRLEPVAIDILSQGVPSLIRSVLPRPRAIQITLPQINRSTTTDFDLPSFFYFAREQWALLTRRIDRNCDFWKEFRALALEPNLTLRIHPWVPLGLSLDSHYSGLLSWAIVNCHMPLLDLLFGPQGPKLRGELFNLPYHHHGNLSALHLAVRTGSEQIVSLLIRKCDRRIKDRNDRTALHHAAEVGCSQAIIRILLVAKVKREVQDCNGMTALHIAAENGHDLVIEMLREAEPSSMMSLQSNKGQTALHLAAINGHARVLRLLLDGRTGTQISSRDEDQSTALHLAAMKGHKAVVRLLLDRVGAEINAQDGNQCTALHLAARNGHEAVVRLLLERNDIEVDLWAELGTPLLYAAEYGHEAVVKLLVEKNANINVVNDKELTPLHIAAKNGHETVVRLLMEEGANVDAQEKSFKRWTPLYFAITSGHEAVVRLLVGKGTEVYVRDKNNRTPLYYAVEEKRTNIVELLIECGAEIDVEDERGWTPLCLAAHIGCEAAATLLLVNGAKVNAKVSTGKWTPLHIAARSGQEATARLLLQKGAEVDATERSGCTPLLVAAKYGHEAVTKLLLDKGVKIEAKDDVGNTPLSRAAEEGHKAVVKLLLENGAKVNAKDKDWMTPLHKAVEKGHEGVARLLLSQRKIEVSAKAIHTGRTPLHLAAVQGNEAMIRLLLENGAEVNVKNTHTGRTPLEIANHKGHTAAISLLKDWSDKA